MTTDVVTPKIVYKEILVHIKIDDRACSLFELRYVKILKSGIKIFSRVGVRA
jgi:hypothetical protein